MSVGSHEEANRKIDPPAGMILQTAVSLPFKIKQWSMFLSSLAEPEVTLQHLLTHTTGLGDTLLQMREMLANEASLEQMFAATCRVPLRASFSVTWLR
jgi:hypothetical protein